MVKWSENKPLKIPPVPAPATVSAPVAAPIAKPEPAPTAFGEEDIPMTEPATVPDDLYAPLPENYQPTLPDENAPADVVQP